MKNIEKSTTKQGTRTRMLVKSGAVICAVVMAVALAGCGSAASKTPTGMPDKGAANGASTVQARSADAMATTAAMLDATSENETMGGVKIQTVALGQAVTGDGYTFTLKSYEYVDSIALGSADDTSGHLNETGKKYLVVHGTFTNTSNATENIRKGTAAWFTFGNVFPDNRDEYGVQGWTDAYSEDKSTVSNYIIGAGESRDMFVYAEVEDTVAATAPTAQLLWGFNSDMTGRHYEANSESVAYQIALY